MKMRPLSLAALIAANIVGIVSWQMVHAHPTTGARPDLQCFADKVLARTPPGSTIHFILPTSLEDGGLINHRLRYALPERYVSTNRDMFPPTRRPDWIVTWRGGCDGTVERAGSR